MTHGLFLTTCQRGYVPISMPEVTTVPTKLVNLIISLAFNLLVQRLFVRTLDFVQTVLCLCEIKLAAAA